ncbi:hypothetical protein C1645_761398 [Glomus cerebriforme]|uniref:Uncharacterized protein n=1 Tax=Glomus cerebriforme TaxID=658196 RepID=A0A397TBX4_9GLOM|nr:hypothetical protein C1645_761398 [Glomus cerebriforme]
MLKLTSGEYKFPTNGFTILDLDNLVNANEAKFKFVKYDGDDTHFVRLIEDPINLFEEFLDIPLPSPGEFTTSKNLDYCINEITWQLLDIFNAGFLNVAFLDVVSPGIEIIKFRLNIFFGREVYSNFEKENFTVHEWIMFKREYKKYKSSFQHYYSDQFLSKLLMLQGEYKFRIKEKEKKVKDKGNVFIYFNQGIRRRMAKLKYIQEDKKWKVTELRNTNKLANLDIISGTDDPDCRFSIRIRCESYDPFITSKIEKIINEINNTDEPKDGMWFRTKDFEGKFESIEIRQTIEKRRFINENYQISVDTVKKESNMKLFYQQIISLENLNWRDMENANELSRGEVNHTMHETVQYVMGMMRELKKIQI